MVHGAIDSASATVRALEKYQFAIVKPLTPGEKVRNVLQIYTT